jgi:hypothetical protein
MLCALALSAALVSQASAQQYVLGEDDRQAQSAPEYEFDQRIAW